MIHVLLEPKEKYQTLQNQRDLTLEIGIKQLNTKIETLKKTEPLSVKEILFKMGLLDICKE